MGDDAVPLRVPVGVLLLALVGWIVFDAARRLAPRYLPAAPSRSEAWLRLLLVAVLIAVTAVAVLGLVGVLWPAAILFLYMYLFQRQPPLAIIEGERPVPPELRWLAIPTLLLLAFDLVAYLPASPVDWDAATYHLYLPARWLQAGRLFHVPTVFGDNAAAFAPPNGALFFTWQMALTGRDAVGQRLTVAVPGVSRPGALPRLPAARHGSRGGGTDRSDPAVAGAAQAPGPIRPTSTSSWSPSPSARSIGSCSIAASPRRATIVACGLAGGLAAGTKALGPAAGGAFGAASGVDRLPPQALRRPAGLLRLRPGRRWLVVRAEPLALRQPPVSGEGFARLPRATRGLLRRGDPGGGVPPRELA